MNTLHRAKSRCVEVLFRDPRVGLCTADERKKKTDLYDGLMLLSGN